MWKGKLRFPEQTKFFDISNIIKQNIAKTL